MSKIFKMEEKNFLKEGQIFFLKWKMSKVLK